MALPIYLHPFSNDLDRWVGGHDRQGQYGNMELFNSVNLIKWGPHDFVEKVDTTNLIGTLTNGTSAAVTGTVASQLGGICRLTTGTDSEGYAAIFPNGDASLEGACWSGDTSCVLWARLKVDNITTVKIEVGWTDADDDAGAVNVAATPSSTATDHATWVFDTDDTTWAGFQGVTGGVAGAGSAAYQADGASYVAPVNAVYIWLGVALLGNAAKFMAADANGKIIHPGEWQASVIEGGTVVIPFIFAQARTTSSRAVDVDYVYAYGHRSTID